jgi:D-glycero-D-manno-heptose 1,7-bisphosphate phosphatase
LNRDLGWVGQKRDFQWTDTAKAAVRAANDAGYYAFIVTNQAGVAKGFYDESDVQSLHVWMVEQLRRDGANIDDIAYCPHHVDGTVPEYRRSCRRRKPAPGMIEDLCDQWQVDKRASFLIGDRASDLEAAGRAGIEGKLFEGGDLHALVEAMLKRRSPGSGA